MGRLIACPPLCFGFRRIGYNTSALILFPAFLHGRDAQVYSGCRRALFEHSELRSRRLERASQGTRRAMQRQKWFSGPFAETWESGKKVNEKLKQAGDVAVLVQADGFGGRNTGKARHCHDIPCNGHHKFGTHGQPDLANRHRKPGRSAF